MFYYNDYRIILYDAFCVLWPFFCASAHCKWKSNLPRIIITENIGYITTNISYFDCIGLRLKITFTLDLKSFIIF